MLRLYTFALRILKISSQLMQGFSPKYRKFWEGRRNQVIKHIEGDRPIWFHCASLGEFEQGRPIMEGLRKQAPDVPIVLTFFSPSGFEVRKNFGGADAIYYLPIDLPKSVNKFIHTIRPRLAIFIKYEFWFNYLRALKHAGIPFVYVSVLLRPSNYFLKSAFKPLTNILRDADQIFTQNANTLDLLVGKHFQNSTIGGDTRVDRVIQIAQSHRDFPAVSRYAHGKRVIVYGSIWPADFAILRSFIEERSETCLHIIAPHKIDGPFFNELISTMGQQVIRLSKLEEYDGDHPIILVDTMGDLAELYQFADIAYVGGGFGSGIHSILEPAAHRKPLIFGPKHSHFIEARAFIDAGAAKCVETKVGFRNAVVFFRIAENYSRAQEALQSFLNENQGATRKILEYVKQQNWLG